MGYFSETPHGDCKKLQLYKGNTECSRWLLAVIEAVYMVECSGRWLSWAKTLQWKTAFIPLAQISET